MNSLKMNKNLIYSFFFLLLVIGASCSGDSTTTSLEDFDHESQIAIDQALLYTYFEEHYITADGELMTIGDDGIPDGETALSDDPKLDSILGIEANSTVADYKMYYYIDKEGSDASVYGSPSPIDSVYVTYTGMLLDGTVFDSKTDYPIWLQLTSTVQGWSYGLPKFKQGTFETDNEDFVFDNQGEGFIFFPSGLGYAQYATTDIPASSPLVFEIELNHVNLIDTDLDNVPTKFEITIDAAGNYEFYDTDGDGYYDYNDKDDDNDQVLTKDEVALEFPTFDERGNIVFNYNVEETKIVAKETTDGVPNYKNINK